MTDQQQPPNAAQPPPPNISIGATPDGRFVAMQTTIFVDITVAAQVADMLAQLARQLRTGIIIPTNGNLPPAIGGA